MTPAQPIGFFPGTLTLAKRETARDDLAEQGLPCSPTQALALHPKAKFMSSVQTGGALEPSP